MWGDSLETRQITRRSRKILLALAALSAALVLSADITADPLTDIRFRRLNIEDGLSQSSVFAIVQDHQGYMWFGTEDGLNRYDGDRFRIFRSDPDDSSSIGTNDIWTLFVDSKGTLWIGTYSEGLNRYDPQTETFTRYIHDPMDKGSISDNFVRSIMEDSAGDIWVGTRECGLNRLDPETGRFERYRHADHGLSSDNIRFVMEDPDGTLWIATSRGIDLHDPATGDFAPVPFGRDGTGQLRSISVRHIFRDSSGFYWISSVGGLDRFDRRTGEVVSYLPLASDPEKLYVRQAMEDSRGRIWAPTSGNGLKILERNAESFKTLSFDSGNTYSISNDALRTVFEDRSGMIWVGTHGSGICLYSPATDRFTRYRHDPNDQNSLSDPVLWSVMGDPEGNIWFGTNSGIEKYMRLEERYEKLAGIPPLHTDLGRNTIRHLLRDDGGTVWISSRYGGVDRYDPATGHIESFRYDADPEHPVGSIYVRSILVDRDGYFWFATWGAGIDRYDPGSGRMISFRNDPDDPASLCDDNTIALEQDCDGAIWIGTVNGVSRISPNGSGFDISNFFLDPDDPRSISNNYVTCIYEASGGDLWFGSMQGLSRLSRENLDEPAFDRYFMKDGLPNNVIYGILEDSNGNLWLSTNRGISCLDPVDLTFRNYDSRDGLQCDEFNSGAYTATSTGTLIFGGVNGAVEFNPDSVKASRFMPPVVLTGFSVFGEPARLDHSISFTDEIKLSHKQNYFSLEFASLDYTAPDRNRYAYILEGLDDRWTYPGNRRFAGYTDIDPGEYVFKVMGTNADGVWSDDIASVSIVITPPFYRTPWFITLAVLAAGGIIAGLIVLRVRQMLKFERLRSRIAADLHDEIGAGLTEISIMGEVVAGQIPGMDVRKASTEIQKIAETARGLIDSMGDIVWLVDPGCDSLFDLISHLGDSYGETFAASGIHFTTDDLESLRDVRLNMERRQHLLLIFKEALNNSLKHSEATEISLRALVSGKTVTISLTDNGNGFDPGMDSSGNGLGNMRARAAETGGAVTIKSAPGKGTTIEFTGNT